MCEYKRKRLLVDENYKKYIGIYRAEIGSFDSICKNNTI